MVLHIRGCDLMGLRFSEELRMCSHQLFQILFWTVIIMNCQPIFSVDYSTGCGLKQNVSVFCFFTGIAMNNAAAQLYCNSAGGTLPTFASTAQWTAFNAYRDPTVPYWLGYWNYSSHSSSRPGNWLTNNGTGVATALSPVPWDTANAQPENSKGDEFCLYSSTVNNKRWHDISCGNTYATICSCPCDNATTTTTTTSTATTSTTTIRCDPTVRGYVTASAPMKNADAQAYCSGIGGTLPTFSSLAEWNAMIAYRMPFYWYWLGYWNYNAHSAANPGNWTTNNGTGVQVGLSHVPWLSGEPNNGGSTTTPTESCTLAAILTGTTTPAFIDTGCNSAYLTVCYCPLATTTTTTSTVATTSTTTSTTTSEIMATAPATNCSHIIGSFFVAQNNMSNSAAVHYCQLAGGSLPTFASNTDLKSFNTFISSLPASWYWLGYYNFDFHYATLPGIWRTENGTGTAVPFSPIPWAIDEPNNYNSQNEFCVVSVVAWNASWNDANCAEAFGTICYCPIPTTTTSTTTATTTTLKRSTSSTTSTSSTFVTTSSLKPTGTTTTSLPTTNYIANATGNVACVTNKCQNGGNCQQIGQNKILCICSGRWKGEICEIFGPPKSTAQLVALVAETVGCTAVVVCLSVTLAAYIVAKDFGPQSVLIMLSDFFALIAHTLILTLRSPFMADLSQISCSIVALSAQMSIVVSWVFLCLQSLQAHAVTTGLIHKGWWPLCKFSSIILGFSLPAVCISVNFAIFFNSFATPWTCVVNYANSSNRCFMLLSVTVGCLLIIFSESAGMIGRKLRFLLKVDRKELLAGQIGQRSTVIIFMLSSLSFVMISVTVYSLNPLFVPFVLGCNWAFAIAVVILHSLENPNVRGVLMGWVKVVCRR